LGGIYWYKLLEEYLNNNNHNNSVDGLNAFLMDIHYVSSQLCEPIADRTYIIIRTRVPSSRDRLTSDVGQFSLFKTWQDY
jgi:hypothetical protein